MFTLQKNPTFKTTARIIVPTDEGDVEQTMGVKFRLMSDDANQMDVVQFLRDCVLSMDDIVDDAGKPLTYDAELREAMLAVPFVRVGLMRAYWAAVSKAKMGN
jgi:hypothetical protein